MEKNVEQIIAQNLVDLRKSKNIKQSELSEAIGYSDKTISRWENGASAPDISTLLKLADFYDVSLEDLTKENAVEKRQENKKQQSHEEILNFYSMISLGVLTIWIVAILIYLGLIMIRHIFYWQIFVLALPFSALIIYRKTRRNFSLKWFNFLMLSLIICGTLAFFYLVFLSYNFWQLFILVLPLEGISVISSFFTKRETRTKRNKRFKPEQ